MLTWSFNQHPLPVLTLLLSGGAIVYRQSIKFHSPDVPWYLLLGILIGPVGHIARVGMNTEAFDTLLEIGALLVLFEGGRHLPRADLRFVWSSVASLASVGVIISLIVMALTAHFVFGLPPRLAIILGVLLANTDPASVIPVISRLPLPSSIRTTVEAESAFNDVVSAVLLGTIMVPWEGPHTLSHTAFHIIAMMALAVIIGSLTGTLGAYLVTKIRRAHLAAYLSVPVLVFGVSKALHINSYLVSFIAGLMWRPRSPIPLDPEWNDSVGAIARMMVFVGLGMALPINALRHEGMLGIGMVLVLIFGSRPLAVLGALGWLRRWRPRQMALMMWVRESGVISAVLAIRASGQFPRWRSEILATVFIAILVTVAIQAPTTSWVARWLGVEESPEKRP